MGRGASWLLSVFFGGTSGENRHTVSVGSSGDGAMHLSVVRPRGRGYILGGVGSGGWDLRGEVVSWVGRGGSGHRGSGWQHVKDGRKLKPASPAAGQMQARSIWGLSHILQAVSGARPPSPRAG